MKRDEHRLGRLLRVRSLQLDLKRAEEAAAANQAATVAALAQRIQRLAVDAGPRAGSASGLALAATAHYRERLDGSQREAGRRVAVAEQQLQAARARTLEAGRDHGAIEKLVDRARRDRALDEMRKLADAPAPVKRWHSSCSDQSD